MTRPDEERERALEPHREEQLRRAMQETADRLRSRGMFLTGRETSDELVSLLEAVERFENTVERLGGDLMVDEASDGAPREPDDEHFVLPRRDSGESVAGYIGRVEGATATLRRHRPHSA